MTIALSAQQSMDKIYVWQKDIYDITRRYYLLGRDDLIHQLAAQQNDDVLDIGCGTGRNLIRASTLYPHTQFFGIDVSTIMLSKAQQAITRHQRDQHIHIAPGDACCDQFLPHNFPRTYNKIYFSYTLSMIPQWQIALVQAINALKAGGELWIVDFGQLDRAPAICKLLLFKWLALFSVHPQPQLEDVMRTLAARHQLDIEVSKPYKGYVLMIRAIKQP